MQFLLVLDGFRAQNSSYAVNILESLNKTQLLTEIISRGILV